MKRIRRYWWIFAIIIVLPFPGFKLMEWQFSRMLNNVVVLQTMAVILPDGDRVAYINQAPKRLMMGPADTQKIVRWTRKDGESQDYPISSIGAGYSEIEFRIREDGKALWLIDWDVKKVVATLDLNTGRFTTGGAVMEWGASGYDDNGLTGNPEWATMHGGKSLGRKKF